MFHYLLYLRRLQRNPLQMVELTILCNPEEALTCLFMLKHLFLDKTLPSLVIHHLHQLRHQPQQFLRQIEPAMLQWPGELEPRFLSLARTPNMLQYSDHPRNENYHLSHQKKKLDLHLHCQRKKTTPLHLSLHLNTILMLLIQGLPPNDLGRKL